MYERAILAVLTLLAACVTPVSPPASPRTGHVAAAARAPEVARLEEVLRIHAVDARRDSFEVLADGTLVVARSTEDAVGTSAWSLDVYDARLERRWTRELSGRVEGVQPFEDGRLLVAALTRDARDLEVTVLDPAGQRIATRTLEDLVGAPCRKITSPWLVRAGREVVSSVYCGNQVKRVWLDSELRAVRHEPMAPGISVEGVQIDPAGDELALLRAGQRHVLTPSRASWSMHLTTLGADTVAAMSRAEWRSSGPQTQLDARAFVTRLGARTWRTDLVSPQASDDATVIVGAGSAPDTVLVVLQVGRHSRVAGVPLPPAVSAPGTRFPEVGEGLAIAELDPESGGVRRIAMLQPRTPWSIGRPAGAAATPAHIVVASGDEIVVFARQGTASGPPREHAPDGAPPVLPLARLAPDRLATVAAAWASVCGPRVRTARPSPCRIEAVAIGPDGTVAVGGGYHGANALGATKLPRKAYQTGVLAVFEPDGRLRWHKTFGGAWHNGAGSVVVRDDGAIVVAGLRNRGFALDGRRLPDRDAPRVDGAEAAHMASATFLAVFDRAGTLALLEDVDALVHGDRSSSHARVCGAEVARAAASDEVWVRADCPDGARRLLVRGASVARVDALGARPPGVVPRTIGGAGQLLDGHVGKFATSLLVDDGVRAVQLPVFAKAGGVLHIASADGGAWIATTRPAATGVDFEDELLIASITPAGVVSARVLATARDARFDGLTVDDRGRAIASIVHARPLEIGGHTFHPSPFPAPDVSPRGHVLVRLAPGADDIDRVIVPTSPVGGCVHPSHGEIHGLSARGTKLAITMSFGLEASCGVRGEPSTVLVYDVEPAR